MSSRSSSPPAAPDRTAARWIDFLGRRTLFILAASTGLSLLLFLAEYGFAYVLQAFLGIIGVLPEGIVPALFGVRLTGQTEVIVALLAMTTLRGVIVGAQNYERGAAEDEFRHLQRSRIVRWALDSQAARNDDVVRRFTEVASATGTAIMSLQLMVANGLVALLLMVYLLTTVPILAALLGAGVVVLAAPVYLIDRRIRKLGEQIQSRWAATNGQLLRTLDSRRLIRVHGMIDVAEDQLGWIMRKYHLSVMRFHRNASVKLVLPQVFGVALVCGLAVLSRYRLDLDAPRLVIVFYLLLRVVQLFMQGAQAGSRLIVYWPQVRALQQWWTERRAAMVAEAARDAASGPRPVHAGGAVGFRVRALEVAHDPAGPPVLSGVDLDIPAGSITLLRGPSGAGKSTLVGVLLGLFPPDRGDVIVVDSTGGTATPQALGEAFLASVGYAESESYLFPGTIRDNLQFGLAGPPEPAALAAALALAQCDFVDRLPGGLDYMVTERGDGLSAGQRQRLGITRALLRNPALLVLDEATSNLDPATERLLLGALRSLTGRTTVLLVSHRPAVAEFADGVLHVEDGQVVLQRRSHSPHPAGNTDHEA